jgi:hypothetical protein
MLAGHYAATRTPSGLKRLIIANSPASVPLLVAGTNFLLEKFPSKFVENLRRLEEEGKTTSPEYQQGVMQFYRKHACTTNPWPQGWIDSFNALEKNPTVMWVHLTPGLNYDSTCFDTGSAPQISTLQAPSRSGL